MNKKVSAIVIKSIEINETDKLVTLLTDSDGKLTVLFKGVKKPKAKLKAAAESFCFGEYELVEKGGRYIASGFTMYELFYELRGNIEKYYLACALLEIALHAFDENEPSGDELVTLVSALRSISDCKANIAYLAIKLVLKMLGTLGFSIEDFSCRKCKNEITGDAYFTYDSCSFYCAKCAEEGKSVIDKNTFALIKNCVEKSEEEISCLPFDGISVMNALRIMYKLVYFKLFFKNDSLVSFAKLCNSD